MSEKCPRCGRGVGRGDARCTRCTRCGASLLGVELEGTDLAMAGPELVIGRAGGERTGRLVHRQPSGPDEQRRARRPRLAVLAVLGAVALLAGIIAVTSGRSSPNGAASPTTAAGDSSTTAAGAPTTTAGPDGGSTTSTSVDHRETRADDGTWTAFIARTSGNGPRVGTEHTGLTMVSIHDGQTVEFDDLDGGASVSVTVSVIDNNGSSGQPLVFAGGAVLQLGIADPPSMTSVIVYANGDVRSPAWLGPTIEPGYGNVYGQADVRITRWFGDRTDVHTIHLVDLATATLVRTVRLPAFATPTGVQGDDPVVVDPAGRSFAVAADGTLSPTTGATSGLLGNPAPSSTGRRVETDCDAGLTACVQTYVGEDGRRTPLLDASRSTTTGVAVSPAGRHLVALYPQASCDVSCRFGGPSTQSTFGPLAIVDIDSGAPPMVIASTPTRTGGIYYSDGRSTLTWSTDGSWLFFSDTAGMKAWRPGIAEPVAIDLPSSAAANGGYGFAPAFVPTSAPSA